VGNILLVHWVVANKRSVGTPLTAGADAAHVQFSGKKATQNQKKKRRNKQASPVKREKIRGKKPGKLADR